MKKIIKNLPLIFILFCLSQLVACATSPTGRNQLMLFSPESAISSSKTAYVQTLQPLASEGKINNNNVVNKRINTITGKIIGQTIIAYPETEDWQWEMKVIDEPETMNAWCMAGGKMAIYTGIIDKLSATDDELAQIIGHEVSHAVANHTAEKMSVVMASQVGLLGLSLAIADKNNSGIILSASVAAAGVAITLPNSRAAEEEADEIGIKLAAMAGYDPRAAATLWQKMAAAAESSTPEFLSTHPSPSNRQSRLASMAEEMMPFYREEKYRPIYPLP